MKKRFVMFNKRTGKVLERHVKEQDAIFSAYHLNIRAYQSGAPNRYGAEYACLARRYLGIVC